MGVIPSGVSNQSPTCDAYGVRERLPVPRIGEPQSCMTSTTPGLLAPPFRNGGPVRPKGPRPGISRLNIEQPAFGGQFPSMISPRALA
jgi:hypothetical protein